MATLQRIFGVLRTAAFFGIIILLLYVEYRFVHGNFSNAFNPLVQLFVVGSTVLLPLFWILLVIALGAHFGKRIIRRRLARLAAGE